MNRFNKLNIKNLQILIVVVLQVAVTHSMSAQINGSILSPTHVLCGLNLTTDTYKSGTSEFKTYGGGFYASTIFSFAQFFAKAPKEKGFMIRDIWGVRFGLGAMKTNAPPNRMKDGFWGMIGLDYFGLQGLYGLGRNNWLSLKVYQSGELDLAHSSSIAIHGLIVQGGIQLNKVAIEFLKGFKQKIVQDNWLQTGINISYNYKKNKFLGIRMEQAKHENSMKVSIVRVFAGFGI